MCGTHRVHRRVRGWLDHTHRMIAVSALLMEFTLAHVSMTFIDGQAGPIRGANSPTGNARRHVSGACGSGNPSFGANGVGTLQDGATIKLRQTYAAGHTGANQKFRMSFLCGAEGTLTANALANAENALTAAEHSCTATKNGAPSAYEDTGTIGVNAAQGPADNPYEIECTLPTQGLSAGETQSCTVAVISGGPGGGHGAWGDCVDVNLLSAAAPAPPAPPPAPLVVNTGSYGFSAQRAIDTSAPTFTCCALNRGALVIPDYAMGAATFTARMSNALAEGCRATAAITAPTTSTHDIDTDLIFQLVSGDKYTATIPKTGDMAGQEFLFTVESGQLLFENLESEEQPIICDGTSALGLPDGAGVTHSGGGDGGLSGGTIAALTLMFLILVAGCVCWYYKKKQRQKPLPPPEYGACARKPPAHSCILSHPPQVWRMTLIARDCFVHHLVCRRRHGRHDDGFPSSTQTTGGRVGVDCADGSDLGCAILLQSQHRRDDMAEARRCGGVISFNLIEIGVPATAPRAHICPFIC